MPVPDYQSLMLPVLVASSKGEVRIGDVVNQLADQLKLNPEERSELLPSGKQTLFQQPRSLGENIPRQGTSHRDNRKGTLKYTDRGLDVLQSQPARIDNGFLDTVFGIS